MRFKRFICYPDGICTASVQMLKCEKRLSLNVTLCHSQITKIVFFWLTNELFLVFYFILIQPAKLLTNFY